MFLRNLLNVFANLKATISTLSVMTLPPPRSCAQWIGDWVTPGACLDVLEKNKFFCPYRESNPVPSSSYLSQMIRPTCTFVYEIHTTKSTDDLAAYEYIQLSFVFLFILLRYV